MLQKNIKELRKKHSLSQEQLARKAGITYSTLTKVEGGTNKNPTLDTIKKIADGLNTSIDKLIGRG